MAYKTSSWVLIFHEKKCYTHNYIKHHLPRQIIPDSCRYQAQSRQLLIPFNYQYIVFSKILAYNQEAGYLFWTGSNLLHIPISNTIFYVRIYQKVADITFNLVSYLYLFIIKIPFSPKFFHINREAGYLFFTGRNVIHIILSSIICHVRLYQIVADFNRMTKIFPIQRKTLSYQSINLMK